MSRKKRNIKRVRVEIICNCLMGDKKCKLCNGTGRRVEYQYTIIKDKEKDEDK